MAEIEKIELKFVINGVETSVKNMGQLEAHLKQLKKDIKGVDLGSDAFNKMQAEISDTTKKLKELNVAKPIQGVTLSLGEMRRELRELRNMSFGNLTPEEITNVKSRMAELTDEIGDFQAQVKQASSDRIPALMDGLQGLVSIAQLGTATFAMFGFENEKLEKTMVQLIGVSQALSSIQELQEKGTLKIAAATLKDTLAKITNAIAAKGQALATEEATVATKALGKAMMANPYLVIAAAAVAVGLAIYGIVKSMKAQNAAQKEIIDAYAEQSKAISNEKAQLELYLDIAKDSNQSLETRRNAIKKINAISPEYLGNITLENINTKETTKSIKDYNTALENKAKQQALLTITSEKYARILEIDFKNTVEYYKSLSLAEQAYYGTFSQYSNKLTKEKNQLLSDIDNISKSFNSMFAGMTPTVSDEVKKLREEADKLWDEVIAGSQKSLDKLNALMGTAFTLQETNTVGFRDAIDKYISTVGIAKEEIDNNTKAIYNNKEEIAKETADVIIDIEEEYFEKSLKLLDYYSNEYITKQKEVNQEILDNRKFFEKQVDDELDKIEKDRNDEEQRRITTRNKYGLDENIKTYEQELKLLEYYGKKYNWTEEEILKASQNLKERYKKTGKERIGSFLADSLGVSEGDAQQIIDKGAETAQMLYNSIKQIREQNMQEEMAELEKKYDREIELAGDNESKKDAINKRYAKQKEALEKEQNKKRKQQAITDAVINGAVGATAVWTMAPPNPILSGILSAMIAIQTAAQIAVIKSQKFAKGGILKGPSHANGGILTQFGELEGGEGVINKKSMSNPSLAAIASYANVAGGGVPLTNNPVQIIDYKLLAAELAAVINNKEVILVASKVTKQQETDVKVAARAKI